MSYPHAHTLHDNTNDHDIQILISEPVQQPQPLVSDQPPMDVQPKPLIFSKDMNYEQLAMWLTNHPQFVGADYQEDINKLKGT